MNTAFDLRYRYFLSPRLSTGLSLGHYTSFYIHIFHTPPRDEGTEISLGLDYYPLTGPKRRLSLLLSGAVTLVLPDSEAGYFGSREYAVYGSIGAAPELRLGRVLLGSEIGVGLPFSEPQRSEDDDDDYPPFLFYWTPFRFSVVIR